jgi:hypothetical protein
MTRKPPSEKPAAPTRRPEKERDSKRPAVRERLPTLLGVAPSEGTTPAPTGAREKGRGPGRPRPRLPTLAGVAPPATIVTERSGRAPVRPASEASDPPRSTPTQEPRVVSPGAAVQSPGRTVELRRFNRVPIDQPLRFAPKDEDRLLPDETRFADAIAVDISLGGMFIVTKRPAPFGAEIRIYARLHGAEGEFALPAIVRWTKADGMGVQFGPLGAKETLAITEIVREYQESESRGGPKPFR